MREKKEFAPAQAPTPQPRSGVLRWAGRGTDVGLQVSALRLTGAQHQHLCGWSHLHCRACMLAPELKEALRAQQMEWGAGSNLQGPHHPLHQAAGSEVDCLEAGDLARGLMSPKHRSLRGRAASLGWRALLLTERRGPAWLLGLR